MAQSFFGEKIELTKKAFPIANLDYIFIFSKVCLSKIGILSMEKLMDKILIQLYDPEVGIKISIGSNELAERLKVKEGEIIKAAARLYAFNESFIHIMKPTAENSVGFYYKPNFSEWGTVQKFLRNGGFSASRPRKSPLADPTFLLITSAIFILIILAIVKMKGLY